MAVRQIAAAGMVMMAVASGAVETRGVRVLRADGAPIEVCRKSYALLIGVSRYTAGWPALASVPAEMEAIEAALRAGGFETIKVLDPDADRMKKAFEDFVGQYGYDPNNRLLVFYSGHGWSRRDGEFGYLVPVDAPDPRANEQEFLRRALSMSRILAWCRDMESRHVLFLFDSCFSGAIFKSRALPETPPHITELTARPVRQFITAGDAGQQVPSKSVFAPCFVRGLMGEADLSKDGYITGTELGMYLHDRVIYYRTGQTPQYGKIRDPDLDEGDFVFQVLQGYSPGQPPPAPSVEAPPAPAATASPAPTASPLPRASLFGTWNVQLDRNPVEVTFTPRGGLLIMIPTDTPNSFTQAGGFYKVTTQASPFQIDLYWTPDAGVTRCIFELADNTRLKMELNNVDQPRPNAFTPQAWQLSRVPPGFDHPLNGTWIGRAASGDWVEMTFTPKGGVLIFVGAEQSRGTYFADLTRTPSPLSLAWITGDRIETICQLMDANHLRLQNNNPGDPRPAAFSAEALNLIREE